jgi:hypothetical protein
MQLMQRYLAKMLIKGNNQGIIVMEKAEFYFAFSSCIRELLPNSISAK